MDLFFLWRWMLAVVGAVYTAIRAIQSIGQLLEGVEPTDRIGRIKHRYIMIHLLRIRIRDFWWELLQITALIAALMAIVRIHYLL